MYTCPNCLIEYKSQKTILYHKHNGCPQKYNITNTNDKICPNCGKNISNLKNYSRMYYHIKSCENRQNLKCCQFCDKSYICEIAFNSHVENCKYRENPANC
jgi:hypothetical protein